MGEEGNGRIEGIKGVVWSGRGRKWEKGKDKGGGMSQVGNNSSGRIGLQREREETEMKDKMDDESEMERERENDKGDVGKG